MTHVDTLVIGGGISGLAIAALSARAGRRTQLCEAAPEVGGCLASPRTPQGYWFELGAHTCYNSYTGLIALLEPRGLAGELVPRQPTHLRFLDGDALAPGSNLGALLRQLNWLEAAVHVPTLPFRSKAGRSVAQFYGGIVGAGNYRRALGPMLSAVPSQKADDFPASMLFKSRATRRTDLPRSFTVNGGLQAMATRLAAEPGLAVRTSAPVTALAARADGVAATVAGDVIEARTVVLATPPSVTAGLLRDVSPGAAAAAAQLREAAVDSCGVVLPRARVSWPTTMFAVPKEGPLHSVVTRDSVPDAQWRAFTFHFAPGVAPAERRAHMARLLGVADHELGTVYEKRSVLPSPVVGHEAVVAALDAALAGTRVGVVGNWFDGLAIEDCVQRALHEWARLAAMA
jgi:UDP-galactopyranose mutase